MNLRAGYSASACAVLLLTGCATKPIVDTTGLDMEIYRQDLQHCEQVAEQVPSDEIIAQSAGAGAIWGAIFGAISAAFTGDPTDIAISAGVSAAGAAGGGAIQADQEKSMVAKNCMRNLGYVVLN